MKIEFIEDNRGQLDTYIDRNNFIGNIRIHIDDDVEFYYEKKE